MASAAMWKELRAMEVAFDYISKNENPGEPFEIICTEKRDGVLRVFIELPESGEEDCIDIELSKLEDF